jgi:hypothetical protein
MVWFKANPDRYGYFEKRPWPKVVEDFASRDTKFMEMLLRVCAGRMDNDEFRTGLVRQFSREQVQLGF